MDKQASLLGVQNNKLSTVQDSDMSAENLEHSCSVVVKDLVTSSTHDTRGNLRPFRQETNRQYKIHIYRL